MSRENFAIKAKNIDGTEEYLMVSNIARFKEVPENTKEKIVAHTKVFLVGQEPVCVVEKVEELERRGSSYGIFKVVK